VVVINIIKCKLHHSLIQDILNKRYLKEIS